MGEAIQLAHSISDYLLVAESVWLPTDDGLQPHLRTQAVHHEKRRRWGSQLLQGLSNAGLYSWECNPKEMLLSLEKGEVGKIWTDIRLVRAIKSVAIGFNGKNGTETIRPGKEGAWITAALEGLHVISGCIMPMAPTSPEEIQTWIDLHESVAMLIQSADSLSDKMSLKDAVETRWAVRGLTTRLQMANGALQNVSPKDSDRDDGCILLDFTTPKLNARVSKLPFDIFPHCLPWQHKYYGYPAQDLALEFLQSIPFNFDTLTTRTGNSVIERRGTAWLGEDGIGALAYSGKLMKPAKLPDVVRKVMREIEQWCADQGQGKESTQILDLSPNSSIQFKWDGCASDLQYRELGQFLQPEPHNPNRLSTFFDCALCNHYPDGNAACKLHTDPEHGTHWHRTTAVISCGTTRGFAFRPISEPEMTTWSAWDDPFKNTVTKEKQQSDDKLAASTQLFPGDLVLMTSDCNDLFHHAVYSSPFDELEGMNNNRVSLVLKRALDRGGGKKGHGLKGEGRRSRQKKD